MYLYQNSIFVGCEKRYYDLPAGIKYVYFPVYHNFRDNSCNPPLALSANNSSIFNRNKIEIANYIFVRRTLLSRVGKNEIIRFPFVVAPAARPERKLTLNHQSQNSIVRGMYTFFLIKLVATQVQFIQSQRVLTNLNVPHEIKIFQQVRARALLQCNLINVYKKSFSRIRNVSLRKTEKFSVYAVKLNDGN